MSCSDKVITLILIGDSDISRWPSKELPSVSDHVLLKHHHLKQIIMNHAKSGANMIDVQVQVQEAMKDLNNNLLKKSSSKKGLPLPSDEQQQHPRIFFIMCAGENDISSGRSVDYVISSFYEVVDKIFSGSSCENRPHLLLFGPKFEPWLNDDSSARKSYFQLSDQLSRTCETLSPNLTLDHHDQNRNDRSHHCHSDGKNIVYIDCLTKFCGESASLKGAILGGRARAELKYFDSDGLHLSPEGYKVWREDVENTLSRIICTEECIDSLDKSNVGKKIVLD